MSWAFIGIWLAGSMAFQQHTLYKLYFSLDVWHFSITVPIFPAE
jgi:hypothetical protein